MYIITYTAGMSETLSVTTARKGLLGLVDEVDRLYKRFIITKNGQDVAVLMSASEFEGWMETLLTISDGKSMKDIKDTEKAIKENRLLSFDDVTEKPQTERKTK